MLLVWAHRPGQLLGTFHASLTRSLQKKGGNEGEATVFQTAAFIEFDRKMGLILESPTYGSGHTRGKTPRILRALMARDVRRVVSESTAFVKLGRVE
jgi:hypothetical protein